MATFSRFPVDNQNGEGVGYALKIVNQLPSSARFGYSNNKSDAGRGWIYCGDAKGAARPMTKSARNEESRIQLEVCGSGNLPAPIHIRCTLISRPPDKPHAHQLVTKDSSKAVDFIEAEAVACGNLMIATFPVMAISKTLKENARQVIEKKLGELHKSRGQSVSDQRRRDQAKMIADCLDHDTVTMKFEADVNGLRIEVFSNPIRNSRKVSELEIDRVYNSVGFCTGKQEVHLWVKGKVKRSQVTVVFSGSDGWSATVDPHHDHQGAMLLVESPPYRDLHLTEEVEVLMRLQDKKDESKKSEPRSFTYIPSGNPQKRSRTSYESAQLHDNSPAGASASNASSSQNSLSPLMVPSVSNVDTQCASCNGSPLVTGPTANSGDSSEDLNRFLEWWVQGFGCNSEPSQNIPAGLEGVGSRNPTDYFMHQGESEAVPLGSQPTPSQNPIHGQFGVNQHPHPTTSGIQPAALPAGSSAGNVPYGQVGVSDGTALDCDMTVWSFDQNMYGNYEADSVEPVAAQGPTRPVSSPDRTDLVPTTARLYGLEAYYSNAVKRTDGPAPKVASDRSDRVKEDPRPKVASSQPNRQVLEKLSRWAAFRDPLRGRTLLHDAVAQQVPVKAFELLLSHDKLDINRKTYHGKTALHLAVEANYLEAVELLLEHGADAEIREHQQGNTPAHLAAQLRNQPLLDLFQARAAEGGGYGIDTERYDGLTPMEVWEMNDGESEDTVAESADEPEDSGDGGEAVTAGVQNLAIHDSVSEEQ